MTQVAMMQSACMKTKAALYRKSDLHWRTTLVMIITYAAYVEPRCHHQKSHQYGIAHGPQKSVFYSLV